MSFLSTVDLSPPAMPPKRLSENPPPASSSEEEEEEGEEEEGEGEGEGEEGSDEQNDSVADEKTGGDYKDAEDDDEEEEEEEKSTAIATPQKSDSATDSDSESTQPSPYPSAFNIKFHKPNKSGSKRPESDSVKDSPPPPSKRRNKGGGGNDEEAKNKGSAIQRLWSEDDEIAILKGLSQYKSEKGADPSSDMAAFHDFIKKSLHVDVSKNQLMDKIRRLKKKYQNNLERAETGQDPVFSKPHDEKSFDLSKKVWEENSKQSKKVSEENTKQSGKVSNNVGSFSGITLGLASQGKGHELRARKPMRAPNGEVNSVLKREDNLPVKGEEEKGEIVEEFLWEKYPFLKESLQIEGLSEDVKVTLREQLGMIEKEKLKELEEKWKKLKQAELELFVQRMELVHEQVKLTLDSIN